MAYRGGPSGTGTLKPRKVKVRRTARQVLAHSTPRSPSRSSSRPPQQTVRQQATRKAAAPARKVYRQRQRTALRNAPKAVRAARKVSAKAQVRREIKRATVARVLNHRAREPLPSSYNPAVAKAVRDAKALALHRTHPLKALEGGRKDPTPKYKTLEQNVAALTRPLKHKVQTGPQIGAAYTPAVLTDPGAQVAKNFVKDAIDTPTNVAASAFLTGRALGKAATGNSKELKETWKGLKDETFVGNVLQGKFKKAGKVAQNHPLNSLLEVSGAKAAVGRTGGFTARHAPSKKLRKAGSTKRPDLKLYGHVKGGPAMKRTYSKDIINKGVQKTYEAAQRSVGRDPDVAHGKRQKHQLHQRGNEEIALTEGLRRHGRAKAVTETARAVKATRVKVKVKGKTVGRKKGRTPGLEKHHEPAVALVVERAIRRPDTVREDLVKYKAKLEQVDPDGLYPDGQALRSKLIGQIDGLLKSEKFLADPHPAFHAAERVIAGEAKRTKVLEDTKMLSPDEQAAKYVPYAVLHMGAKAGERGKPPTIQGAPVPVGVIRAHMEANGVREPGFFSQRPGATGKSSFYTAVLGRNMKRPANYSKTRTGASTLEGTHEADAAALVAQGSHSANMAEAAEGFDRYVSEFGIKRPIKDGDPDTSGYWKSHDDASHAAAELQDKVGVELTPMNVGRVNEIKDLLSAGEPEASALTNLSARVHRAFEADSQAGEYVLVPKALADKLKSSVSPRGKTERALQEYSRIFKATVLSSSTKWLFGNVADLTLRSVMEGITPVDVVRGRQVLKGMEKTDPRAAEVLRERLGTNFIGSQAGMETFREKGRIARLLPSRVVAGLWNTQKRIVYGANSALERNANFAALGKYARQNAKRSYTDLGGFFKVGDKGLEQAIDGLLATKEQVAAARFVERVYGRWGKMSPEAKRFLIHAPFAQWLGVATKYVFVTLPLHHPIKTGIIAALDDATEEERKALGFNIDPFEVAGQLEGYLQGGLPKDGKVVPFGRYTSFGILADAPDSLVDFLLPQFQSAMKVAGGEDFLGRDIKNDDGTPLSRAQRTGLSLYTLLEGSVPWLAYTRRLQEGGGSSKPISTVFDPKVFKEGEGTGDAFGKVFNPLRPLDARFVEGGAAKSSDPLGGAFDESGSDDPLKGAFETKSLTLPLSKLTGLTEPKVQKFIDTAAREARPIVGKKVKLAAHLRPGNLVEQLGTDKLVDAALKGVGEKPATKKHLAQLKKLKGDVRKAGLHPPNSEKGIIEAAAKKAGIDPSILWGLYGAETNFGHNVNDSSAGAQGPFQFMPATAAGLGIDPHNFRQAANAAAKYLAQYKDRGVDGMLAAYNAGPAGNPNNPETAAYVPKVKELARTFGGKGGGKIANPGKIVPLKHFPGEEAAKSAVPKIEYARKHFGVGVSDAFDRDRSAGHQSPGHNVTGTAVDFTGTPKQTDDLVKWAVRQGYTVYYDGRFGSTALAGHGPGNHAHVEFGSTGAPTSGGGTVAPSFPAMGSTAAPVSPGTPSRTTSPKKKVKRKAVEREPDFTAILELLATKPGTIRSTDPLAQQKRAASDSAQLLRAVTALKGR